MSGCIPLYTIEREEARGKVLDADSHVPVPGARVHCRGAEGQVAVTSSDGEFDIPAARRWQLVLLVGDNFPLVCSLAAEANGYVPGGDWHGNQYYVIYLHRATGSN